MTGRIPRLTVQYVYILELANGDLYTGTTDDLRRRVDEHQRGKVESTRHFRPLRLIHYEAYIIAEDARRRERYLKTTEGRRFLRQQLKVYFARKEGCESG